MYQIPVQPSPLPFLFSVLLHTNTDDIFQARKRLDWLERTRGNTIITLHSPTLFNVFGSGFLNTVVKDKKQIKKEPKVVTKRNDPLEILEAIDKAIRRRLKIRRRAAREARADISSDTPSEPLEGPAPQRREFSSSEEAQEEKGE